MTDQLPTHDGKPKGGKKKVLIGAGIVVVLVLVAGAVFVLTSQEEAAAAEVYLEPADFLGDDPFSADPLSDDPPEELVEPRTDTLPEAPDSVTITSTSGGEPGLYGGTQDIASCDSQQIVDFLAANPDKAAAWVAALNADPQLRFDGGNLTVGDIEPFINGLTSMVLTSDTRVTNHGFVDGQANAIQSVLQAGTAVLVDKFGVPRVKCFCGNPLLPPQAPRGTIQYRGVSWNNFNLVNVDVVVKVENPINVFILTDFRNGGRFQRPVGSDGSSDSPASGGDTTTTTTAPPTTDTTAPPTTAAPDDGPTGPPPASQCTPDVATPEATLTVVNDASFPVQIVWHSFDCSQVDQGSLQPGESFDIASFSGHIFSAIAPSGAGVSDFTVSGSSTWTIS